jgi:hypothetical protein
MQTVWKIRGEDRRKAYAKLYQNALQEVITKVNKLIFEETESDYVHVDPSEDKESSSFESMEDWIGDKILEYLSGAISTESRQLFGEEEDIEEILFAADSKVEKQLVYDTLHDCNSRGLSVSQAITELKEKVG